jgi:hypothetical protein
MGLCRAGDRAYVLSSQKGQSPEEDHGRGHVLSFEVGWYLGWAGIGKYDTVSKYRVCHRLDKQLLGHAGAIHYPFRSSLLRMAEVAETATASPGTMAHYMKMSYSVTVHF